MSRTWRNWRRGWAEQRRGLGCVLCPRTEVDDDEWGTLVYSGRALNAFVWKTGLVPGYVVAVWSGPHVSEPTELSDEDLGAYWREVTLVGRAVEQVVEPAKMNYLTLGNNIPHLHTHIVPRPVLDPHPNAPLPFTYLDEGRQEAVVISRNVELLSAALARPG